MSAHTFQAPPAEPGKGFFRARRAVAGLLIAVLLAACQATPGATQPPTLTATHTAAATSTQTPAPTPTLAPTPRPTTATTPAASIEPSPTAAGFPLALVDDEGTEVVLESEPERVVSLTPATTELLFALGEGDKVVGRTDFDDFPPEAIEVPAVASFTGVAIEQVVDIDPDLVIAGGNNFTPPGDVSRLRELGFPVIVLYATDVDGVLADIRLVGQAVGAQDSAEDIVADIESRVDEVTAAVAELPRPRTFYEIGNEPELYGPAPDSFVADMVVLAGGDPITTSDPAVFSIPVEQLVSQDPEVIVLGDAAYGVCPDSVASRAGWADITAVQQGEIRPVDDIIVTRPGPRLGEGLAALALAIHPDAAIAPPTAGTSYCEEPAV